MNAYLVIEDGEVKIWIAETMAKALQIAWDVHAKELEEYESDSTPEEDRAEYEQDILQSCELMGEVGNP